MESANKFICSVRLKYSGAWWYEANSNQMLALLHQVAVNQLSKHVALRLSGLEVPSFQDRSLSNLDPLTGVRQLRKGRGK
jgi:hypothetical protein